VRTRPGIVRPDAQIYIGSYSFKRTPSGSIAAHLGLDERPGITIYGQHLQPRSEGIVSIVSGSPQSLPEITPNWLIDPADREAVAALLAYLRRFMRQAPLTPFIGEELAPGPHLTDAQLIDALPRIASAGQHMVGSCRMGRDVSDAIDPSLRVRGTLGLRVADCSAMPGTVSGNTNAAAMAFGWLAADIIRTQKEGLVPSGAVIHPPILQGLLK
jgi:choline dehydrogenase-like flavoprotein